MKTLGKHLGTTSGQALIEVIVWGSLIFVVISVGSFVFKLEYRQYRKALVVESWAR